MGFRNDQFLRPMIPELNKYRLISFDVFDTLIFRTCYEPNEIFRRVGERLAQKDEFHYTPETYHSLRIEAARRSQQASLRRCGTYERHFRKIFEEMPFSPELREQMAELEFEMEKQAIYLNNNIYSFLKHCRELGKRIILISDMYYSGKEILSLLEHAGLDTDLIDGCFVSSDYGVSKSSGLLFTEALKRFPEIEPHSVLHIGDNKIADIEGAGKAGLDSLHYGVVPQEFGNIYEVERKYYNSSLGEIASLRRLAGASCKYGPKSRNALFHRIGAEIIGPVYALFADWLVDFAMKDGVKVILPLMREGELLSRVINRVIDRRGLDLECRPFYSSRHPLFAASIFEGNLEEKISQLLIKSHLSITHLFDELGLDRDSSGFSAYSELSLKELKQAGLYDDLRLYMSQGPVRARVLEHAEKQRELLLQYLKSETCGRKAMTVDIGMKGTAESLFKSILDAGGMDIDLSHALLIGANANNVTNIMNGVKIYSWLGIAGENGHAITKIMYQIQILETLVSASCGTVLRYEQREGKAVPILDANDVNAVNATQIKACWSGVEAFQGFWLDLLEQKPRLADLLERKPSFISTWLRFIEMPTLQEAETVGALLFYDPFTYKAPEPLCGVTLDGGISDIEIDRMLEIYQRKYSYWPQAAVVKAKPQYFMQKFICSCMEIPFIRSMHSIIHEIKQTETIRTVAIFAAAQRGRDFLRTARLFDMPVYCFVDSNKSLWGKSVAGIRVIAPEELGENIDAIVVASVLYSNEIRDTVERHYAGHEKQPRLFCL